MKKHLLVAACLLLAVKIGSPIVSAQPPGAPLVESPLAHLDDDGPLSEPRHIAFGMTPDEVSNAMLGKPDVMLTPEIWVYWQFRSGIVGAEKFDTLVVTYARGRVAQYRLVERRAVQALMEDLWRKATPAVAKKAARAGSS